MNTRIAGILVILLLAAFIAALVAAGSPLPPPTIKYAKASDFGLGKCIHSHGNVLSPIVLEACRNQGEKLHRGYNRQGELIHCICPYSTIEFVYYSGT